MIKVLVFTKYGRLGASSRIRVFQFAPFLRACGVDLQISPLLNDEYLESLYSGQKCSRSDLFRSCMLRVIVLMGLKRGDIVWIQKELFPHFPAFFERWMNFRGIRFVVDLDDAIFHTYDLSGNFYQKLLSRKIDKVMRWADCVIAGNDYLADRARMAGARKVINVPTVIDLERYKDQSSHACEPPRIGWIGTPVTVRYLLDILESLRDLAVSSPFVLVVVGARNEALLGQGFDVEFLPWSEAEEASILASLDIGIMPLPDTPWERGKCGYKLIQYMACGVPVVASPVGVNVKIVDQAATGFLAASPEEWRSSLATLLTDRSGRRKMGRRARQRVEQEFCVQVQASRIADVFRTLAGNQP